MSLEYIKHRQRQWQRKMRRAAKLEAEKEASRVAKMEADTMVQGVAFGMRSVQASGTDSESGLRNTKYNNGNACGLDEIAFYKEEKDASWVASVYSGGTSYNHTKSGGSGLVGYWRFNEGSGTTVKDLSGYGHHGTLTNASYGTSIDDAVDSLPPSGTPTWIKVPTGYGQ